MSQVQIKEKTDVNQSQGEMNDYLAYIKWTVGCSRKELSELDDYIQHKIKNLVMKFRLIAENTAAHMMQNSKIKEEEVIINTDGREYSYAEATKELHRLTDALLSDAKLTADRVATRKQIDKLSLALFRYAKKNEDQFPGGADHIQIISENIKDVIVSFQFQDFVKQRLTHIETIMEAVEGYTDMHLNALGQTAVVPDSMATELLDKFFLSNVKETFVAGLDADQIKNLNITIEEAEEDIELF